jgi:SAM-dependent methyltransferase
MNDYSPIWFDTFMQTISPEQTLREIAFLERQFPLPNYDSILDVCCGNGRHSLLLADRGYQVLGVDRNERAIEAASSKRLENAKFLNLDMRDIGTIPETYTGVILLWQSFGYYSEAENEKILGSISALLRCQGRLVMDIYNRDFFEKHQGEMDLTRNGETIVESKRMIGDRLKVSLRYSTSEVEDRFEWQVYTENKITEMVSRLGLKKNLSCTNYSEDSPVRRESPRMQIVFEKV